MLVHPTWNKDDKVPIMLWMHGRTVDKELDPGRYLRWMRAGIGTCAIDLPGHGERLDPEAHKPENAFDVINQMADEIDSIVEALDSITFFDKARMGIGGMSGGGMASLARLTQPHTFRCGCAEAASGSWQHQVDRPMFRCRSNEEIAERNPILHLDKWREIPLQTIHSRMDEWVDYEGQLQFINALREKYTDEDLIELITFEETGAPFEHAGFGNKSADAKKKQLEFLKLHLLPTSMEE